MQLPMNVLKYKKSALLTPEAFESIMSDLPSFPSESVMCSKSLPGFWESGLTATGIAWATDSLILARMQLTPQQALSPPSRTWMTCLKHYFTLLIIVLILCLYHLLILTEWLNNMNAWPECLTAHHFLNNERTWLNQKNVLNKIFSHSGCLSDT